MRRLVFLCVGLCYGLSFAAITRTPIGGTIYGSDGTAAPGGSIVCTLKPLAGRASDGANTQVVLGPYKATISGSGTVSFFLVPNDVITPAGTWYECITTTTGAGATSVKDNVIVATSVSEVSFGSLQRTNTPSLTLPSVTGSSGTVVSVCASGLCGDPDLSWDGTSNYLYSSADLDGNGTAASADWNGDGTADEVGLKQNAAAYASRLFLDSARAGGKTHASALLTAWAHAAQYGDPQYVLQGGVLDIYIPLFRGHKQIADFDRDGTQGSTSNDNSALSITLSQCSNNVCTDNSANICVPTDPDGLSDGTYDPDSDGTGEFVVGDTIVFSTTTSPTGRAHVITSMNAGDGTICPAGAERRWVVRPSVDEDVECAGGNCTGQVISAAWKNVGHATDAAMCLLGKQLAYAPALPYGVHGPNLLSNGNFDHDAIVEGWVTSASSLAAQAFSTTANSVSEFQCFEGSTSAVCASFSGTGATDYIESATAIATTPGERYVLSGLANQRANYTVCLVTDTDNDGTYTCDSSMQQTFSDPARTLELDSYMGRWWFPFQMIEGAHDFKVRFTKADTSANYPVLDGLELRRNTRWQSDDYGEDIDADGTAGSAYLINDPGDRTIVFTGHSWMSADNNNGADELKACFEAAFETRIGRNLPSTQYVTSGKSGNSATGLLTATTCTATSSSSGSGNCWYESIEKYDPLYCVIALGVNDAASSSITTAQYEAAIREIKYRAMSQGCIPILVGTPPTSEEDDTSTVTDAHSFRDAERRMWLYGAP